MKVFLTARALKNYNSIKQHIKIEWGEKVSEAFEKKTLNFLDLIAYFPKMGTIEVTTKNIRGFQLSKQTRVFYRLKMDIVIILAFFDVRQAPHKKPK